MKKIILLAIVCMFVFTGCKNAAIENNDVLVSDSSIAKNYDYFYDIFGDFNRVGKDNKYGIVDNTGKEIVPCIYDWILVNESYYTETDWMQPNNSELFIVQKDEKWGFVNREGIEIVPCIYDCVESIDEGFIIEKDGQYGFLSKSGKKTQNMYDDRIFFFNETAVVKKNEKYGIINKDGEEIFDCSYESIGISTNAFVLSKNGKFGVMNKEKEEIAPFIYNGAGVSSFEKELIIVQIENKYGIIKDSGNQIVSIVYDNLYINDGLIVVEKDEKYGVFNITGSEIIPCKYDRIHYDYMTGDFIEVTQNGKQGLINKEGKEILPLIYDEVNYYYADGNLIRVKQNGKYGVVNKERKEILPCIYEYIILGDELILANKDEKSEIITDEGKKITSGTYSYGSFSNGLLEVIEDGKHGIINKEGDLIVPCIYKYIYFYNDFMLVSQNDKFGIINKEGKEVVPCIYDWIEVEQGEEKDNIIFLVKDEKVYAMDADGNLHDIDEITSKSATKEENKEQYNIKSVILNENRYLEVEEGDCNCGSEGAFSHVEYNATSELKEGEKIYEANNLQKEHSDSVWVEDVEGFGIGEKINIDVCEANFTSAHIYPHQAKVNIAYVLDQNEYDTNKIKDYYYQLDGFWFVNGFAESEKLWKNNARVKKMKLTINDEIEYIVDLEDSRAVQYIDIDYKSDIYKPISVVAEILEVYEGDKYEDTAITLLNPIVTSNISWPEVDM